MLNVHLCAEKTAAFFTHRWRQLERWFFIDTVTIFAIHSILIFQSRFVKHWDCSVFILLYIKLMPIWLNGIKISIYLFLYFRPLLYHFSFSIHWFVTFFDCYCKISLFLLIGKILLLRFCPLFMEIGLCL